MPEVTVHTPKVQYTAMTFAVIRVLKGVRLAGSYLIIQGLQDYGLLVLRVAIGFALIAHGYPKMGSRRESIIDSMRGRGIPGPVTLLVGYFQFIAGILLILGAGTQIIGLLVALEAIGALYLYARVMKKGYLYGYESSVAYLAVGLALFFLGAGAISVDHYLIPLL